MNATESTTPRQAAAPPVPVPPNESAPVTEKKAGFGWHHPILLALGLAVVAGVVLHRHASAQAQLETVTQELSVPSVQTVLPTRKDSAVSLTLPGKVQANMEATIYARVSGYLKRWLVDIGAPVKEGQLLAEIDTPEIDQQLNQARAVLTQSEADLRLAQITADRWKNLLKDKAVSQQEADEKSSALEVKKADLAEMQANVKRLEELQSFQKVYAPFAGVITARKTDVGNLVTAGSGSPTQELFRLAQTQTLRVYVNVPEAHSGSVTAGVPAKIEMATMPGESVTGKIVRTAGAIDPDSHTLLVELEVPNPQGTLLPGGYARVHFEIALKNPPLVVPSNALLFRAQGAQLAVVNAEGAVQLKPIKIGRDFGSSLEVIQGLNENDRVIINPSDSLSDGARVRVETKPSQNTATR